MILYYLYYVQNANATQYVRLLHKKDGVVVYNNYSNSSYNPTGSSSIQNGDKVTVIGSPPFPPLNNIQNWINNTPQVPSPTATHVLTHNNSSYAINNQFVKTGTIKLTYYVTVYTTISGYNGGSPFYYGAGWTAFNI